MNKKNPQPKSQRQLQIGEQIKRILAEIFLQDNLLNIKNTHITILQADISPDAKNAKIYIDIFSYKNSKEEKINNDNKSQIIKLLNDKSPHFRYELAKKITLRNVPQISFVIDKAQDNLQLINNLITEENNKIK